MAERGRIAYLTGQYPNAGSTFIMVEVEQLRRLGFSVATFAVRRPASDQFVSEQLQKEHAATTYLLSGAGARLAMALVWALATRPHRLPAAARTIWKTSPAGLASRAKGVAYLLEACLLAREVRRRGIRHIHNHIGEACATVAMAASGLSGVPFSITEHGSGIFFHPRAWGLGAKIDAAAFTTCITDFCRSQCLLFTPRHAWSRVHVVRACVQPEFLNGTAVSVPEAPRLLFVGRLSPEKGVPFLIEAVRGLESRGTPVELTLIGDGPLRQEVERELAGLGDRLRLLRWCGSGEVLRELERARVLVLPSLTEGLPVVIMEALARRRPVIATRIAGIPDLVEEGVTGWLIPPGSVGELQNAIRRAVEAPAASLERMGAEGAARVRQAHDPAVEIGRLAALLDQSAGARSGGS